MEAVRSTDILSLLILPEYECMLQRRTLRQLRPSSAKAPPFPVPIPNLSPNDVDHCPPKEGAAAAVGPTDLVVPAVAAARRRLDCPVAVLCSSHPYYFLSTRSLAGTAVLTHETAFTTLVGHAEWREGRPRYTHLESGESPASERERGAKSETALPRFMLA